MKGNGARRLATIASVALTASLVLGAPPALAKKKGKKKKGLGAVVTRTAVSATTSANGTPLTATATCPKGKQAFGGGFSAPPSSNSAVIFVNQSRRTAANAWTASGTYLVISAPGAPLALTAYVYCRRLAKAPSEISSSASVPAANNTTPTGVTPTCPSNRQLISGGFSYQPAASTTADLALVFKQLATGTAWAVQIANSGAGAARTLTGHAYCAKGLPNGAKRVLTTSSNSIATLGQVSTATPGCTKGRSVSAGGYESPFPTPGTPRALYLVSRLSGTNWIATAAGGFSPGTLTVSSQATCT